MMTLLGINIDHVATLRQARHESFPDPINMALEAIRGGADSITAHLREDRRHIQDEDIKNLKKNISVPLNMEMSTWPGAVKLACQVKPAWACLVPERRQELTTEGGLNVRANKRVLGHTIRRLRAAGTKVSLFIEPSTEAVLLSKELGADAVELHTGAYARIFSKNPKKKTAELHRLQNSAERARALGLLVNAGHGIDYENVRALSRIFPFHEFNIGFSVIGRALQVGVREAVREMKTRIKRACVES